MKKLLALLVVMAVLALQAVNPDVFLLIGQSNMAGFGEVLPGDKQPKPGVWMLRGGSEADFKWVPATHPYHHRTRSDRYGLAGAFGLLYREMWPEREVAFVAQAIGGAPLCGLDHTSAYYQETLAKLRWAKANGTLKGVLWHQGETDSFKEGSTATYATRLEAFFQRLRKDVEEPALPVIIGDLCPFFGTYKEHNTPTQQVRIRKVRCQLRMVAKTLPNAAFAESTGLVSIDQTNIHFNRASYIILGLRYFDAYWQMVTKPTPPLAD